MNEDRPVLRIVSQLQEFIGLLVLRPCLIRHGNIEILHSQLLDLGFFRWSIESGFSRGSQIDDRGDALSFQLGQLSWGGLTTGAEFCIDLEEILNSWSRLSDRDTCQYTHHQRPKHYFLHYALPHA